MSGTKRNYRYVTAWILLQGREFDMPNKESYSRVFQVQLFHKIKAAFFCVQGLSLENFTCCCCFHGYVRVALFVLILSFVMILNTYY